MGYRAQRNTDGNCVIFEVDGGGANLGQPVVKEGESEVVNGQRYMVVDHNSQCCIFTAAIENGGGGLHLMPLEFVAGQGVIV